MFLEVSDMNNLFVISIQFSKYIPLKMGDFSCSMLVFSCNTLSCGIKFWTFFCMSFSLKRQCRRKKLVKKTLK